jgi:hypothetical protein
MPCRSQWLCFLQLSVIHTRLRDLAEETRLTHSRRKCELVGLFNDGNIVITVSKLFSFVAKKK